MRLRFPHIPRFISATIIPVMVSLLLWAAFVCLIGLNSVLAVSIPTEYRDRLLTVLSHPFSADAHRQLAQTFWASGARPLAKQELALTADLSPVLGLDSTIQDKREADELKYWRDIAANHPDYRDAYIQLASLTYARGDLVQTRSYLTQAAALDPNGRTSSDLLKFISSLPVR